ncbi:MAG: prephenate dehydrogenase/arogenate dehydrogenase family protein [Planctomycetota bacterium]
MEELTKQTVAIVGLGQIGGSLGLALRAREAVSCVLGVDADESVAHQAEKRGAIDEVVDLEQACARADVVVLAAPMGGIVSLVPMVAPALGHRVVLTDVGSVKLPVRKAVESAGLRAAFVGGHPLAGTEGSGIASSDPRLFEGAVWVLCPGPDPHPDSIEEVSSLVRAVGATPYVLDEEVHDRVVAATSHLPYGIAAALVLLARGHAPLAWTLAAGSFRGATRVARSDVRMSAEMLWANRQNVLKELASFREHLKILSVALEAPDMSLLENILAEARKTMDEALPKRG